MDIVTHSAFLYGYIVTDNNNFLPFLEGIDLRLAQLKTGSYTLTKFATEIARAMNEVGANEYDVTVDRPSRKLTVSGSANFDFDLDSIYQEKDIYEVMGFVVDDKTGSDNYTSDISTGNVYIPQYRLQNYIDFEDERDATSSTKSISASGDNVEVVKFGDGYFMSCNIVNINDEPQRKNGPIKENPNGIGDLRSFLKHITDQRPVEFMIDYLDFDNYTPCLLESTQKSRKGTGYKILRNREVYKYRETGNIVFRRIS